jgi:hypothetical protein
MLARLRATIPSPVLILAVLSALDGITTHIVLAGGGRELNPLLAALFAVHPAFGEAVRTSVWLMVLGVLVYVHKAAPWCRYPEGVEIAMILTVGTVVWANIVQLILAQMILTAWLG